MGFQPQASQPGESYPLGSANAGSGPLASVDTPLARQSSIYSLTLEEFQNALGEPGKKFASMNMDELLKNIWTAEESLAIAAAMGSMDNNGGLVSEVSLQKQGSLNLPSTLSRKTVDQVWKGIQQGTIEGTATDGSLGNKQQEITFGEMTLEDFLVKAGVVREEVATTCKPGPPFGGNLSEVCGNTSQGGDRSGNANGVGAGFGDRTQVMDSNTACVVNDPLLSLSSGNMLTNLAEVDARQLEGFKDVSAAVQQADWLNNQYRHAIVQQQQEQQLLQQQAAADVVAAAYANSANRVGFRATLGGGRGGLSSPIGGGIGAGFNNGGLGVGLDGGTGWLGFGTGSPQSPGSDGAGPSHVNLPLPPLNQYGLNEGLQGRKRGAEGNVVKAIERRQRRMIKNRESAARSRARKQAYTVELEAEVTQLKEENTRLRKKREEDAEKRKKLILSTTPHCTEHLGMKEDVLRRTHTGPW